MPCLARPDNYHRPIVVGAIPLIFFGGIIFIIAVIGTWTFAGAVQVKKSVLPDELIQLARETTNLLYLEKFKDAEDAAKRMIRKAPEHPIGYFHVAAVLDSWEAYYQSDLREEDFFKYCDLALEKGEVLLENNRGDGWVKFFMGGADGFKGTREARYERWITAFRYGWKGVSALREVQKMDPTIIDVFYGIGTYNYWRSSMMQVLRWMPGVEDHREEGISQLLEAKNRGLFSPIPSSIQLVGIYCNEKRNSEALILSNELLALYPNCVMFLWGKAQALYGLKQFDESEKIYRTILSRVESESIDNHYHAIICHFWLAQIALDTRKHQVAIAECNRMEYYKIEDKIARRLQSYFSKASAIKEQAALGKARSIPR